MNVIDIDDMSIYTHKYGNITYKIAIPLTEKEFLAISFNNRWKHFNCWNHLLHYLQSYTT